MKNYFKYFALLAILISQFSFSQEEVEKHPLLSDKFVFTGGLFIPTSTFNIGVNGDVVLPEELNSPVNLPEGDIDFGNNFDIKEFQSTFAIGFQWRFAKKWKLFADYFGVSNRWDAKLDEEIEWEDVIYQVGADVNAGIDLGVLRSAVGRVLSQGAKHELGVSLGAHIMMLDVFVEGAARLASDNEEESVQFRRGSVNATAPLPNIGAWYYWAPTSRWALTADVDWLYIAFGDYQGGLWDLKGGVQFQVVDFFGVGASYRYYGINLEVDKTDWNGSVDLSYQGPMLMVNFNF